MYLGKDRSRQYILSFFNMPFYIVLYIVRDNEKKKENTGREWKLLYKNLLLKTMSRV